MAVVLSKPKQRRPRWYELTVEDVRRLTDEAVTVTFAVPQRLRPMFDFTPGQHLTLRRYDGDEEIRRSYSICSTPAVLAEDGLLRVGIKAVPDGSFSGYANRTMCPGEVVEVLPPLGSFGDAAGRGPASAGATAHYAAIVAGSGITPVLSIATAALEAGGRFTLLYGNKTASSVMFADELADLKDRFPETFHVVHVLSREPQAAELLHGRLDPPRLARIFAELVPVASVDDWFLCGPYGMVTGARQALSDAAVPADNVHTELFYADEIPPPPAERPATGDTEVTIVLDGRASTFTMSKERRVLDAALGARSELPYACKGGVCATCRAKVLDGKVHMARNFALDGADVAAGYVLTCQSTPVTDKLVVDYDA